MRSLAKLTNSGDKTDITQTEEIIDVRGPTGLFHSLFNFHKLISGSNLNQIKFFSFSSSIHKSRKNPRLRPVHRSYQSSVNRQDSKWWSRFTNIPVLVRANVGVATGQRPKLFFFKLNAANPIECDLWPLWRFPEVRVTLSVRRDGDPPTRWVLSIGTILGKICERAVY